MTMNQEEIIQLRKARDALRSSYGVRDALFKRYEEIYFMGNSEIPKDSSIDVNDWKVTTSPAGRNKVTGVKQILDTSDIQIKVKNTDKGKSDKIELGLKTMLKVSGEYKRASVETDNNLAAVLYGPVVQIAESVDDLIIAKTKDSDGNDKQNINRYVKNQLVSIRKRTPFLISTMNPTQSFPKWGEYGMVGHLHEYTTSGSIIKERWGVMTVDDEKDYKVMDFFHYDMRFVEAEGVNEPLFADRWLTKKDDGDLDGVTSIPVFVRYAGGSTLFHKPEEQLQSLLYAYAKGEWDKRETLFWTYLFTAIYQQGIPGPVILQDPDDTTDEIKVTYRGGVKVIKARGKLENIQVIDGDVIQLKNLMENETAQSTVQAQTIGGTSEQNTFSGYVASVNAGKIVLNDPKEAIEKVSRDTFMHILQRIKSESILNDLISPADIPDDVDIEVTYEPNLTQDDLRNATIVTQLKGSGANVSDEWLNTNLLKIADSNEMFKQKTKEEFRKAIIANIINTPELIKPYLMAALGMRNPATTPPPAPPPMSTFGEGGADLGGEVPQGMMGGEQLPQMDAMIPPQERL